MPRALSYVIERRRTNFPELSDPIAATNDLDHAQIIAEAAREVIPNPNRIRVLHRGKLVNNL